MFCPQCGATADPAYRFCTRCGSALSSAPPPPQDPTANAASVAADVYASFWPRACAFLIDYLLVLLVCLFLKGLLGIKLESRTEQWLFWATVAALWLYKSVAERSARQATLGKLAFDLKVTTLEGERIGGLRAVVRNVSQALSALIMFIGFLMPAFTRRHQALHDMCAGTLVTRRQYAPAVIAAVADAAPEAAAAATDGAGIPRPPASPVPRSAKAVSAPTLTPTPTPVPVPVPVSAKPRTGRSDRPVAPGKKGVKAPGTSRSPGSSSRPDLPLKLSFHDALIGADKRAVLENLSDTALEVMLDVKSPVTGAHFSRTFVINPRSLGQIGRAQGWPFARGQLVTVSNPEYRPIVQTVG
jgi:uncharacterized RDD family membrane protein YckC